VASETAAVPTRLYWAGLALVLIGGLGLRLWGIDHGLPTVYNPDERHHYVPIAVNFFARDNFDPGYFVNPPGLTYLLYIVYTLWYGPGDDVVQAFGTGSSEVWIVARVTVALVGVVAAWLTYVSGARLFSRGVGLLAALLIALAFLPVFQSHFALNDVPAMAAVALGLVGTAGVLRRGHLVDYAVAGTGIGLACATKYTAGIILLPLLVAGASRARGQTRQVLAGLATAAATALVSFVVANPYSVFDPSSFLDDIGLLGVPGQGSRKLGQSEENGILYYLWVFTWGLGWVPSIAALGGAVRLFFVDRLLFAVLVPATVLFVLFMGLHERFFGRWLLSIFPIVALLAAYGTAELLRVVSARAPRAAAPAAILATVALVVQSLVHTVHTDLVLTREDTRAIAREWRAKNIPAGTRMVVEPMGVVEWGNSPWQGGGSPWQIFRPRATLIRLGILEPDAPRGTLEGDDYTLGLDPRLIESYESGGFCFVQVGSSHRGRAFATPELIPKALAYYRELERVGSVVFHVSPYDEGEEALPLNFDTSTNYYPLSFHRPGPEITIYELMGGSCGRAEGRAR
jgi:4-amino-4-deoxy-L-arabinose transferase-like glycosyltransferase